MLFLSNICLSRGKKLSSVFFKKFYKIRFSVHDPLTFVLVYSTRYKLTYFYFCIWIYNCFIPFVERLSFLPLYFLCILAQNQLSINMWLYFSIFYTIQLISFLVLTPLCVCPFAQSCSTLQTRLLCPWNFPGKSTRAVCHFLARGDLPNPGISPTSPASPPLAGRFFTTALLLLCM